MMDKTKFKRFSLALFLSGALITATVVLFITLGKEERDPACRRNSYRWRRRRRFFGFYDCTKRPHCRAERRGIASA